MSELPKKFGVDQLIVDKASPVTTMSGEKSKRGIETRGEFGLEGVYYDKSKEQWYVFLGDKTNPSNLVAVPSEIAKIIKTGLYIEKKSKRYEYVSDGLIPGGNFYMTYKNKDLINCHKSIYMPFLDRRQGLLKDVKEAGYASPEMYSLFLRTSQRREFRKDDKEAIEEYFKKVLGNEGLGIGQVHDKLQQVYATHSFFVGLSVDKTRVLCFERVGNIEHENLPFQGIPLDRLLERVSVDFRGNEISTFWGCMKYSDFKKLIIEEGVDPRGRDWRNGHDTKDRGEIQVIKD